MQWRKTLNNQSVISLLLLLSLLAASQQAFAVVFEKELLITDVSVTDDTSRTDFVPFDETNPDAGAWSFGRLVEGLAGSRDPAVVSDFVLTWLNTWAVDQVVNGDTIEARAQINQLISDWQGDDTSVPLDMTQAPFRLLAIVNRIDLRRVPSGGFRAGNAGEGRFVFGVLGLPRQFTVIFEYELPATTVDEVQGWANQWHALGVLDFGETYNTELRKITDQFSGLGVAPNKPNGSAINQVRTNENALNVQWELREFHLVEALSGVIELAPATVSQTPRIEANDTQQLANFINNREAAVLAETHVVPAIALGGHSHSNVGPIGTDDFIWDAIGINNPEARHKFSLNTCNGCHTEETSTGFVHIAPRQAGIAAELSGFLSGPIDVPDPKGSGLVFSFDEPQRRIDDLNSVLNGTAESLLAAPVVERVH